MKEVDYETLRYQEVWDVLSIIDVSKNVKKKNNMSYLSWPWAWKTMMENYPEAQYEFDENQYHKDGTGTVSCTIRIGDLHRTMWLPVMEGFKNTSQVNPDARGFGDSRMRCLVKCMGMFGLGFYLYAGEDLPEGNERTREASRQKREEYKAKQEVVEEQDEGESDLHRAIEDVMEVFLEDASSIDQLKDFWLSNRKALKVLELNDIERYSNLLSSFKSKKSEIAKAAQMKGEA
jgi:hypothetical protein